MSDAAETSLNPASRGDNQLQKTAKVGLAALLGYCIYSGWHLRGYELILGIVCLLLAAWPALRWMHAQPYRFPAFETFMLTAVTSYVLPLVNDHTMVVAYSDDVVSRSMLGVIGFQVCAILTFFNLPAVERRTPFWTRPLFSRDIKAALPIGLWLHVGYLTVGTFTTLIPDDVDSVLRAIFFGISISCSFLLGRYWGDGDLPVSLRGTVICAMVLELILQLTTLYLISAISGLIVFFLAYISAGKRIPWVTLGFVFLTFSVLHNGKTPMREKYWAPGARQPGVLDLPSFFGEWVQHGLETAETNGESVQRTKILERASLLQMMCLVVDASDHHLPYLMGETYAYVPAQLVPRLLWPDKPTGQMTTKRLSIYYGLQDEESTRTTSIAFGVLTEAYANFGPLGMAALGLLFGWAGKTISIWTRGSALLSNGSLIMILVMAWSIQVELPMSVWVASLYQATICVLAIPFILRFFMD